MEDFSDIKIKSNHLLVLNECIICSDTFNKCMNTKCGHSFCEKCILDCININNCCPTCKTPLKKEELVKNYLVDDIISYIKSERPKEEYNNIQNNFDGIKMNSIQSIFFDNLKQIFNTYNSFFENIEKEKKLNLEFINKQIFQNEKELNISDKKLKEFEKIKNKIETDHLSLIKHLENSIDSYMKNLPVSPLLLPIKTKIIIEKRNVIIDHLVINPTDSTDILFLKVKNYFENLGDEIFFDNSNFVYYKNSKDLNLVKNEILLDKGIKFISTGLMSGDVIYLIGDFSFRSDAPKNCLTYNFDENKLNILTDYFSCENCKLNCN